VRLRLVKLAVVAATYVALEPSHFTGGFDAGFGLHRVHRPQKLLNIAAGFLIIVGACVFSLASERSSGRSWRGRATFAAGYAPALRRTPPAGSPPIGVRSAGISAAVSPLVRQVALIAWLQSPFGRLAACRSGSGAARVRDRCVGRRAKSGRSRRCFTSGVHRAGHLSAERIH
jgi:hypothetical protein